jgi:hypothetical protein
LPFGLGLPTSTSRPVSVALGAVALLAVAVVVVSNIPRRLDSVAAPLPASPTEWSRVLIDPEFDGGVDVLAATPRGLLAWVGGDDENRLYFSVDGRTWMGVPAEQLPNFDNPSFAVSGAALAGDDQRMLIVGREAWASEDGITWSRSSSPAQDPEFGQGAVIALAAGGPGFVAVGAPNKAWYSTDGTDWALAEVPPPPGEPSALVRPLDRSQTQGTVEMEGVAASGSNLLAWGKSIWVHDDGSATFVPVFWVSNDGTSWTTAPAPGGPVWGYPTVSGGPKGFVVVNEGGGLWFSADGTSWERVAQDAFGASRWATEGQLLASAIAGGSAGYVAVATDGRCNLIACSSQEAVIWTSPDGRSWARLPNDARFEGTPTSGGAGAGVVAAWGDRFVVGGAVDGGPATWISDPDGPND